MIPRWCLLIPLLIFALPFDIQCQQDNKINSVTVPVKLDHNRMLVEAEILKKDGSWRKAILWVDSGNPTFFMSESLARDLGVDLAQTSGNPDVEPPQEIRIGGMKLNFENVKSKVMLQPFWLFKATHNDANLPSTVLRQYDIIFDYPKMELTIAQPGTVKPKGVLSQAAVNPQTGIVQIDALIDGEKLSFALDNGASYSFISDEVLDKFSNKHRDWSFMTGAIGYANMWGWWPRDEQSMRVMRVPEILWGKVQLENVGIVGVPKFSENGPSLGGWYSQKTVRPVDGFLGANALKNFRIEIDYKNSTVYFDRGPASDIYEMDLVGLTLQPQEDGSFLIIGVARQDGKRIIGNIEPGDKLIKIDDFTTHGETLGTVVDKLRGTPRTKRILLVERNGKKIIIETVVERYLE